MPKIPSPDPHRPWRRPVWARSLPSLLAALFLAACANAAGPPAPEALTTQDSEKKLALHAEATAPGAMRRSCRMAAWKA